MTEAKSVTIKQSNAEQGDARGVLSHSTHIDVGGLRYPPYDRNRILREIVIPS